MFQMIASPTRYMMWYNRWQNDIEESRQKIIDKTGVYGKHCLGRFHSCEWPEGDRQLTYWLFRGRTVRICDVLILCNTGCRDFQYSWGSYDEPPEPCCTTRLKTCRYDSQARHICKMLCLDPDYYSDLFGFPY